MAQDPKLLADELAGRVARLVIRLARLEAEDETSAAMRLLAMRRRIEADGKRRGQR
jgi:hypothetical protein